MIAIDKIDHHKFLQLINVISSVILGFVFMESIETIYCKDNGRITAFFSTSGLHFMLVGNLVIDWISANIKIHVEERVSPFMIFGIPFLLLLDGYICILAFDNSSSIPLLILIGVVAFSIPYDICFFVKTSREMYVLVYLGRLLLLIMLLLSYFTWRFTGDIGGVLSIMAVFLVAKIARLYSMGQQEVS